MSSPPPEGEQTPPRDMRVLDLAPLMASGATLLGEGASARVLAVAAPGFPPACVKAFRADADPAEALREAEALHSLRAVAGVPRLLAYCRQPVSFLMTRHGTCTLGAVVEQRAAVSLSKGQLCEALRSLSLTLERVHEAGFVHSDLKAD